MNERIQELACQAEEYADSIVDQGGEFHETYTKKFAELLIRECANCMDEKIAPPSHPMNSLGYRLKEHFGVEE